jgi:hypothetical protein
MRYNEQDELYCSAAGYKHMMVVHCFDLRGDFLNTLTAFGRAVLLSFLRSASAKTINIRIGKYHAAARPEFTEGQAKTDYLSSRVTPVIEKSN